MRAQSEIGKLSNPIVKMKFRQLVRKYIKLQNKILAQGGRFVRFKALLIRTVFS